MIDSIVKRSIVFAIGLFLLFSLAACQSVQSPEQTTQAFWSAVASNDLNRAKKHCSTASQNLLLSSPDHNFENVSFNTGKITIDGNQATVETQIIPPTAKHPSFTTFLLKENKQWKVDYQRSVADLAGNHVFNDFFNELNTFSKNINKHLEQQLPLIKKELESFAKQLDQQINDLGKQLKKPSPHQQHNPYQDAI
ncbi:MAG: hypothetical protein ACKE51_05165 [Methylococcaceae bacterium]